MHTEGIPVIAEGNGYTVTSATAMHPPGAAYVMLAVPAVIPFTMPKPGPVVATMVLLLLHVPPPGPLASAVVSPIHTARLPVIGSGGVFTVTVLVVKHNELSW